MKSIRQMLCLTALATAAGACFAQVQAAGDAAAATGHAIEETPATQTVTREQVRHERDLAVQYGLLNNGKPWDHWVDHDMIQREQALEQAIARDQR